MKEVRVKTGYRVHINSIDMNGFSGRCCGGLGFGIENPNLEVRIKFSISNKITSKYPEKIEKILKKLNNVYKLNSFFDIEVHNESFEHVGLGSETQLFLAIAVGALNLCGLSIDIETIAKDLSLAGVSGIGYGAFKFGNFIIDSGYLLGEDKPNFVSHSKIPPKIIMNINVPEEWKVILVIPKKIISISNAEEDSFFAKYTPVPINEVSEIAYYTLMGIVPAIYENNFENFIKCLNIVTKLGTKKAELLINEKTTDKILIKMEKMFGFSALSSLGPCCYTFINNKNNDIDLQKIKDEFTDCDVIITKVRNRPFEIIESEYE